MRLDAPGLKSSVRADNCNQDHAHFIVGVTPGGQYRWSKVACDPFKAGQPTLGKDNQPRDLTVDKAGNIYITGTDFKNGIIYTNTHDDAIYIMSLTADGNPRWHKEFGAKTIDKQWDKGLSVATDSAGNVYLTGTLGPSIDFGGGTLKGNGIFLASFTTSGKHRWSKAFKDGISRSHVATDASGNVYLFGNFRSYGFDLGGGPLVAGNPSSGGNLFLASFYNSGKHRWSKAFGNKTSSGGANDVAVDPSGNIHVTGYFGGGLNFGGGALKNYGSGDVFVASFTSLGLHRWSKSFGSGGYDQGNSIATDKSGNLYFTGYTGGGINFGGGVLKHVGGQDVFVASLTSAGAYRWSRTHGSSLSDYGEEVAVDANGDVLVSGNYRTYYKSPFSLGGATYQNGGGAFLIKLEQ